MLKKINEDGAKGKLVVVFPDWPNQAFYLILTNRIVQKLIKLSARKTVGNVQQLATDTLTSKEFLTFALYGIRERLRRNFTSF